MGSTTSLLWRRDNSPKWADEALTRGLQLWGKRITPIEAKFLFRGLLYSTVAVPIEPADEVLKQGVTLKVVQGEDDSWGVPVFTHPDLLAKYAGAQGWTKTGKDVPWTAVEAKEAFKTLSQVEGVECWVNPGDSTLKLDQDALKILAAGDIPDPRTLGVRHRLTARVTINITESPKELRSALSMVPDRTVIAIKLALEQLPDVSSATLFKPAEGPVTLGLKSARPGMMVGDNTIQPLERVLARSEPPIAIVTLTSQLEKALQTAVPPFYWRKQ